MWLLGCPLQLYHESVNHSRVCFFILQMVVKKQSHHVSRHLGFCPAQDKHSVYSSSTCSNGNEVCIYDELICEELSYISAIKWKWNPVQCTFFFSSFKTTSKTSLILTIMLQMKREDPYMYLSKYPKGKLTHDNA